MSRIAFARTLPLAIALGGMLVSGCASEMTAEHPDGVYQGRSGADDAGEIGEITFTIKDHKITEASFVVRDKNGKVHDESYGKSKANGEVSDKGYYKMAQDAVAAEHKYAAQFVETGDAAAVDVIAGASLSHRKFLDAVADALSRGAKPQK